MGKKVEPGPRVILGGHDVTRLCAEANIGLKPNHVRTVTLVLFDPKLEVDPETGAITISVTADQ